MCFPTHWRQTFWHQGTLFHKRCSNRTFSSCSAFSGGSATSSEVIWILQTTQYMSTNVTDRETEDTHTELFRELFFFFPGRTSLETRVFLFSKEVFVVFLHVTNLCRSGGFCCHNRRDGNFKEKSAFFSDFLGVRLDLWQHGGELSDTAVICKWKIV